MGELQFRLAQKSDKSAILDFIHTHWDSADPFLDNPVFFAYYFEGQGNCLHFALAEEEGELAALAGYIPASQGKHPDVWISFWLADKTKRGAGLELMAKIMQLVGCRSISCNNIRPKTRVFYEFLGFSTGRMGHFYRLAQKECYQLARVQNTTVLPVSGSLTLRLLPSINALKTSGFIIPKANPYKDFWHIERRYFHYPGQSYQVYAAEDACSSNAPQALLITRTISAENTFVLRIVDYIGSPHLLPQLGIAIDTLMQACHAEYADFYCAGIEADLLRKTGFTERLEEDTENIVPNYLQPPLFQNTDYYYFTSDAAQYCIFKADGDQDRPR